MGSASPSRRKRVTSPVRPRRRCRTPDGPDQSRRRRPPTRPEPSFSAPPVLSRTDRQPSPPPGDVFRKPTKSDALNASSRPRGTGASLGEVDRQYREFARGIRGRRNRSSSTLSLAANDTTDLSFNQPPTRAPALRPNHKERSSAARRAPSVNDHGGGGDAENALRNRTLNRFAERQPSANGSLVVASPGKPIILCVAHE